MATIVNRRLFAVIEVSCDTQEGFEEFLSEGWKLEERLTPRLVRLKREVTPNESSGFSVTVFWPDGGLSGHDTYSSYSSAATWQQAVLDVVEEMEEMIDIEEGTEITFDDVIPGQHGTAVGVNRQAVVVWKDGRAQWKEA